MCWRAEKNRLNMAAEQMEYFDRQKGLCAAVPYILDLILDYSISYEKYSGKLFKTPGYGWIDNGCCISYFMISSGFYHWLSLLSTQVSHRNASSANMSFRSILHSPSQIRTGTESSGP